MELSLKTLNSIISEGIKHEFSSPITPQQNGVVERKNRTLQELARVMLHAKHLPYHFWAEAINTACHVNNRVTMRVGTTTTLYELSKGRKPTVKYFHVFGSKCYFLALLFWLKFSGTLLLLWRFLHFMISGIFCGYKGGVKEMLCFYCAYCMPICMEVFSVWALKCRSVCLLCMSEIISR